MNKQKITIIGLVAALVLISMYMVLDKLAVTRQQEMVEIYQQGYDQGVRDTVTTLYVQTQNCQRSTITVGNLTKDVFDLDCLQQNNKTSVP